MPAVPGPARSLNILTVAKAPLTIPKPRPAAAISTNRVNSPIY